MAFENWSTDPASNTLIDGINWTEGQLPGTVNGSARQMMADLAVWRNTLLSGASPFALITGATFSGPVKVAAGQTIELLSSTSNGGAALVAGDATHSGFVALNKPNGTRAGRIGDVGPDGAIVYVNEASLGHNFFGGLIKRDGNTVWDAATLVNPIKLADFQAGSNANGYWTKRPDGNGGTLIEQWGRVTLPANGSNQSSTTLTFPIQFNVLASVSIDFTAGGRPTPPWGAIIVRGDNDLTVNGTTVAGDTTDSAQTFAQTVTVYWKAKGY